MASNKSGSLFTITTWGESHGSSIGVIIDGCPANIPLKEEDINKELRWRRPGFSAYTSSRKEKDHAQILSGIFEGQTTGAPIAIMIKNADCHSSDYDSLKDVFRPGHASYPYHQKYGIFDHRGSGRASARETACRVAAGAVAQKLLDLYDIEICSYLHQAANITSTTDTTLSFSLLKEKTLASPIFCPDPQCEKAIIEKLSTDPDESFGGIVHVVSTPLLPGLGDPIYEKLSANLAKAYFSIPGVKGVEIGSGFLSAAQTGSTHNDLYDVDNNGQVITTTNHCGGILAGISTGMPLDIKIAFKPAASSKKIPTALTIQKKRVALDYKKMRSDPCIAIRGSTVCTAMTRLVIADALLLYKTQQYTRK